MIQLGLGLHTKCKYCGYEEAYPVREGKIYCPKCKAEYSPSSVTIPVDYLGEDNFEKYRENL